MTLYCTACSHCGGVIERLGGAGCADVWHCIRCGCQWTLSFEIVYKGLNCPVHGRVKA